MSRFQTNADTAATAKQLLSAFSMTILSRPLAVWCLGQYRVRSLSAQAPIASAPLRLTLPLDPPLPEQVIPPIEPAAVLPAARHSRCWAGLAPGTSARHRR